MSADKLYLWSDALEADAVITSIDTAQLSVCLSQTLFHAQGGGQPADRGAIEGHAVLSVRHTPDGDIDHVLDSIDGLAVGQRVAFRVDSERRRQHARLHSAGHLIADAALRVDPALVARSGHHWPGEARVEFEGAPADLDAFQSALQQTLTAMIAEDLPLHIRGQDGGVRTVQIDGAPTPCGGTHVCSTAEIGAIAVRRAQIKRGALRVSYDVS